MRSEDKYFQDLDESELWQRYCGFLGLSIHEFMEIQKELLLDQIDRVADSTLGKKIMGNVKPRNVKEFCRLVPLTTYADYEPYLSERQEDVLAEKPHSWCHSAGRGGHFKWIPHSREFWEKNVRNFLGSFILASSARKGEVNISPGLKVLAIMPPPPYGSGLLFEVLSQYFSFQAIPPLQDALKMDFQGRLKKGLQIALRDGVDVMAALGSVLVKIGEGFTGETRGAKVSSSMLHPRIIFRLLRGWLWSKLHRRTLLPKDLWNVKGIVTGGVDTAIYKDDIAYYWGRVPYEFYVVTEAGLVAMQAWNKRGLIFCPDTVFLEFLPEEEILKYEKDRSYKPSTVLLNEVEEGKSYEVVITQLYGMPFLRYRLGDLVKVVALTDEEAGINLPQIVFQRKVGEVIDLGGLAWLDEKTLWKAIANTGIKYTDWSACKEHDHNQSFLRVYIELKEEKEATELETMIDEQLKIIDVDYVDIGSYLKLQPVRVTLLSPGTFERYMEAKRKEGADLAHMKPEHINAHKSTIHHLLELSKVTKE